MRWLSVAVLTVVASLAARPPDRITAQAVPAFVVSGTDARVLFAGYGTLPAGWNLPGFDDSRWAPAQSSSHRDYLTPLLEAPFAGSGAAWISLHSRAVDLPDYQDASLVGGRPSFATYLFRTRFTLSPPACGGTGTLAIAADNFGWLYLNGDPAVARPRDPVDGLNFGPGQQARATLPPARLRCGENVLAARVENGSPLSLLHRAMAVLYVLAPP